MRHVLLRDGSGSLALSGRLNPTNKNILYRFFNRIGCLIYSVEEELNPENKEALTLLSNDVISHNRKILKRYISEEVLIRSLRKDIQVRYGIG